MCVFLGDHWRLKHKKSSKVLEAQDILVKCSVESGDAFFYMLKNPSYVEVHDSF